MNENLHLSPSDNTALFIKKKTPKDNLRDNKSKAPSMIDWLIDYIVFYAVSAIFRIYNGVVKKERKLKGTKVLKNSPVWIYYSIFYFLKITLKLSCSFGARRYMYMAEIRFDTINHLGFPFPLENFSLIWRRHHYRWGVHILTYTRQLIMVIEQWGFLSVPHLL